MSIITFFTNMDRKKLILWGGISVVSLIILIVIIVVATQKSEAIPRGRDAISNVPLIDGHNDVPNNLREILKNQIKDFHFDKNLKNDSVWGSEHCKSCHTDIPRMREGKLGAQFWVAYVSCKTQFMDAVAETLEQIDVIKRLIRKYSNDMQLVTHADGIMDAFRNNKIGSLIAVEGGHSIDSRLGVLRTYYDLGVRYMTLTHTCNTPWADASPTNTSKNQRLTEFGKKIVLEMNRLGMMVDLSHVSADVMRDAIATSKAPVIFSHSNSYAVYNHHRNVPDDVLQSLKKNRGIIMINFYKQFVGDANVTIASVVQHINYIANLIGPDHIGIGADFDGVDEVTFGLEDVSKYPILFDALYLNNSQLWSIYNLEKLAANNLLRVFKEVEKVRDELADSTIIEDWIPKEDMKIDPPTLEVCRTAIDVAGKDEPTTVSSTTLETSPSTETTTLQSPVTTQQGIQ